MFDSGRAQLLPEPAGRCTVWVSSGDRGAVERRRPLDHAVADLGAGLRRHQLAGQRHAERERHRLLGREPARRDLLPERLPADGLDQVRRRRTTGTRWAARVCRRWRWWWGRRDRAGSVVRAACMSGERRPDRVEHRRQLLGRVEVVDERDRHAAVVESASGRRPVQPLAIASSSRRSSTRSGTLPTSSASATASTVTVPVPSGCITTSTVTSSRQPVSTSAQATTTSRRSRVARCVLRRRAVCAVMGANPPMIAHTRARDTGTRTNLSRQAARPLRRRRWWRWSPVRPTPAA